MEAWRKEVQASIERALESDEDEEEGLFSAMVGAVMEEVEGEAPMRRKPGGSTIGRSIFRDREAYHHLLYQDYFAENPTYGPVKFRRRYRMRHELFMCIMDAVANFDPWFVKRKDAVGRVGLNTLQKCIAANRMLGYGLPTDACDEYCRLGESTTSECMKRFVKAVRGCFESIYLRHPTHVKILSARWPSTRHEVFVTEFTQSGPASCNQSMSPLER